MNQIKKSNSLSFMLIVLSLAALSSCKQKAETSPITELLKFDESIATNYEIEQTNDFSTAKGIRVEIRITVEEGLDELTLKNTITKALSRAYFTYNKPKAISVLVYRHGQSVNGAYTIAKADFAPNGDWGNTDYADLNNYKVVIDVNDSYFGSDEIVPILIPNGSKVKVYNETKYTLINGRRQEVKALTVDVFNSSKDLISENKIGEIPNNTEVEIIDVFTYRYLNGESAITYKVKYKNLEGWIWDFKIKTH